MSVQLRAGKELRLTRRGDISRVFEQGRRANDSLLTVMAAPNGLPHSRVGVGVSGKHGGAVQRNRVKRLCREAFRLIRPELPTGWDFFIMPRAGRELTLQAIQRSLRAVIIRATREAPAVKEGQ